MNIELVDTEIPENDRYPVVWPKVVRTFIKSGSACALVRAEDGGEDLSAVMLNRANVGLRRAIERQKAPAKVIKRGSRIYLKRTE